MNYSKCTKDLEGNFEKSWLFFLHPVSWWPAGCTDWRAVFLSRRCQDHGWSWLLPAIQHRTGRVASHLSSPSTPHKHTYTVHRSLFTPTRPTFAPSCNLSLSNVATSTAHYNTAQSKPSLNYWHTSSRTVLTADIQLKSHRPNYGLLLCSEPRKSS